MAKMLRELCIILILFGSLPALSAAQATPNSVATTAGADAMLAAAASGDVDSALARAGAGGGCSSAASCLCGQGGLGARELLDVGHANNITFLSRANNRILSQDLDGRFILWDAGDRARLASGEGAVSAAGDIFVVSTASGAELRDLRDGSRLRRISTNAQVRASLDGSYLYSASESGLTVWSLNGSRRFLLSGDYGQAKISATARELRVALGPAGNDVIQLVNATNGQRTRTPAFIGDFSAWFVDGSRFLTLTEETLGVYSSAGRELQQLVLPHGEQQSRLPTENVGGQGNYFWFRQGIETRIYAIGQASPATVASGNTVPGYVASAGFLAIVGHTASNGAAIFDLRGSQVVQRAVVVPGIYNMSSFAIDAGGRWAIGNGLGVVLAGQGFESTPAARSLSCGAVLSIAGARSGRAAVALANGQILIYDLTGNASRLITAVQGVASRVQLSDSGSVLAAQSYLGDFQDPPNAVPSQWIRTYTLPNGAQLQRWSFTSPRATSAFLGFELSRSGTHIAIQELVSLTPGLSARSYMSVDGSVTYLTGTFDSPITRHPSSSGFLYPFLPSPNGSLVAFSAGNPYPTASSEGSDTHIYQGASVRSQVAGAIGAWLSDDRALYHHFDFDPATGVPTVRAFIGDDHGNEVGAAVFPVFGQVVRAIDQRRIYVSGRNTIYSIVDGSVLWERPVNPPTPLGLAPGDVTSRHVVYVAGRRVKFDPY